MRRATSALSRLAKRRCPGAAASQREDSRDKPDAFLAREPETAERQDNQTRSPKAEQLRRTDFRGSRR